MRFSIKKQGLPVMVTCFDIMENLTIDSEVAVSFRRRTPVGAGKREWLVFSRLGAVGFLYKVGIMLAIF